ncbi:MAG: hypothetical protein RSA75_03510 [Bacteroidales bacterium]
MKSTLLVILLSLWVLTISAQTKISGIVTTTEGKAVEFANVIAQDVAKKGMYSFTTTNQNGEYSLVLNINQDSLAIVVTSLNLEATTKFITNKSQRLNFKVKEKILEIKETVVQATIPAMRRGGDTLTYIAAKYIDANDIVVEDILKKLPGVDVEESGKIKYHGKEISKFYVEGLDMLGGRYAIASKNINAKDIHSINVYENHQHVKALKEISRPDAAAMNITLKEGAKGTWTGSILAGGGYKPGMWKGELSAMYFGKKMQSINTYKSNNTGDNVAREFSSQYDGAAVATSIIGVQLPSLPPLDENLYLKNNIHALSSNFLFKLNESTQLKLNANYAHDYRESDGISRTIQNIAGAGPIVIDESIYAAMRSNRVNMDIKIENNKEKSYLDNTLYLNGDFNKDFGNVTSNGEQVQQDFKLPSLSARNNLRMIVPIAKKLSFNIRSDIAYNNQPTSLQIKPMLFPEIFGVAKADNAVQTLNSSKFTTNNSLFTSYRTGGWDFAVGVGFNAHIEDMNSQLYTSTQSVADSMRNNINWQRYDLTVGPSISYKLNEDFFISAYVLADFMSLHSKDKVRNKTNKIHKIIASPSLRLNGRITHDLKYSYTASYLEFYGGLYDSYGGFIMTDYRNIATKDGELRHTKNQNYSASMNYSNALDLVFANIDASYWTANSNLTYAYNYDGALTYIESVATPNKSQGLILKAKVSKQFLSISTLFTLGGGWNRSWREIIRQGDMLNSRNDFFTTLFSFNTRFCKWLTMDYKIEYNRSENKVESLEKIAPINYIKQNGELLFDFGNGFTASLDCEHYYNGTLSPEFQNMVFLGAELRYKWKKITYSIEGRNLLGTDSYSSAFTSDITDYRYSYTLRPLGVIATVRFNF